MDNYTSEEIIDICESFAKILSSVERGWSELYDEIGELDKETSDLVHEIELTEFDYVEGFQLSNEIKAVRARRRALKDSQALISPLKDFASSNRSLSITLFKVVNEMKKKTNFKETRLYFPRVRKDLKLSANLEMLAPEMALPEEEELTRTINQEN